MEAKIPFYNVVITDVFALILHALASLYETVSDLGYLLEETHLT